MVRSRGAVVVSLVRASSDQEARSHGDQEGHEEIEEDLPWRPLVCFEGIFIAKLRRHRRSVPIGDFRALLEEYFGMR